MNDADEARAEPAATEDADAEQRIAAGVSPAAVSEATIEADLDALSQERDDFRELAQRVQADFENYRKRMLREQTEKVERANEQLIEQLLPVLDNFELALDNLDDADEKVRKGVELVYAQLVGVLEKVGVERIDALGEPFDPNQHEAVAQEDGEAEPVVCDILRSGYRLRDRVLRPATVRVTRAGT